MTDQYFDALIDRVQSVKAVLKKNSYTLDEPNEKSFRTVSDKINSGDIENIRLYKEAIQEARSKQYDVRPAAAQGHMTINSRVIEGSLDELNNAIEDGRIAFKDLIKLSNFTFATGLGLLILAAISGILLQRESLAIIFGVFGIFAVGTVFIMKPNEEIQKSLTHLLQAQTVFLDFYNQVHFWAPNVKEGENLDEKRQASQAMHESTTFALKALQDYVEPRNIEKGR